MFVHTRIKEYLKMRSDIEVRVFVTSRRSNEYCYDGVKVIEGNSHNLEEYLINEKVDRIVVHFLTFNMTNALLKEGQNIPKFVWVHGYEAISWKRRVFNARSAKFLKYMIGNLLQLHNFRKFVKKSKKVEYVFVSEWMRKTAEEDLSVKFNKYHIVPNGIDTKYFCGKKKAEDRYKVLLIRPFSSRKYATDIACKAILEFSKYKIFSKFEFTIVGSGKFFFKDVDAIKSFNNVRLVNSFLNHEEIKKFHQKNGVFLCPTRQDAQGVSMCEAMASGLVPVTTNSTAIPEFVQDKENGILTNSSHEIVSALLFLEKNEKIFLHISENARESIIKKCELDKVTEVELSIITEG